MTDGADRMAGSIKAFLREQLACSPEFRALAIEVAEFVLRETAPATPLQTAAPLSDATQPAETAVSRDATVSSSAAPDRPTPLDTPAPSECRERGPVALRLGDAEVRLEVEGTERDRAAAERAVNSAPAPPRRGNATDGEIDLRMIAQRSRIKAESCRLFAQRRDPNMSRVGERVGERVVERDSDREREREFGAQKAALIEKAKALPSCFLWVCSPDHEQPTDSRLRTIADAYEALADAAALCARVVEADEFGERTSLDALAQAMRLLAEASSALRVVVGWSWLKNDDHDQDAAHQWLRRETAVRQIYVPRHMSLDDPADPGRAATLRQEVRELELAVDRRRDIAKRTDQLLGRIRYHAKRLADGSDRREHDCTKINVSLDTLVAMGIPLSDLRLRSVRRDVPTDLFPETVPPHRALLHCDNLPTATPAGDDCEACELADDDESRWSERVEMVRDMLGGRGIVVVGGDPRPQAIERIQVAFAPSNVSWVDLAEHGPGEPMRAPISRTQTALVVILVKLCGHHHVDEARALARESGKAFVMLPAGYNPEQIATQVLEQTSGRLSPTADAGDAAIASSI